MRVNAIYSRLAVSHCALAGRSITISKMLHVQQSNALSVSAAVSLGCESSCDDAITFAVAESL